MRGDDQQQSGMFSYVSLEERVPQDHPLRRIREMVDEILRSMAKDFDGLYAKTGRPSVPPERLLRAVLLQIFYTVRSERLLMEQMHYNLLFRWFVGLEMDEPVWNHAVFSKNRERLLNQEVAQEFFRRVLAKAEPHLSDEHFTVDGTLIEAWASQKSFQKKEGGDDQPGQVSRREAQQRYARIKDRSGCAVVPEEEWAGSQAGLSGSRVNGKPARPDCACDADAGRRQGRA
jgi:transposase